MQAGVDGVMQVVHANPEVADLMRGAELPAVDETVKRIHRGIEIHARKGFHIEQFEIKGKVPGQAQQKPGRGRRRRGRDDEGSVPVAAGEAFGEGAGQFDEAVDEA